MTPCPCGSGLTLDNCCGPILANPASATTAESLMRARYTAYTVGNIDFVMATTHSASRDISDREAMEQWANSAEWCGLEIVRTEGGQSDDQEGTVEFKAHYKFNGIGQLHHERSLFKKEENSWAFVNGEDVYSGPIEKPQPVVRGAKTGRNDPCPCGSGKKFKKCCGA